MRVECPACGTAYEAPDAVAGRRVRCASCGHVFAAGGASPPAEAPAAAVDDAFDAPVEEVPAAAPDRAQSLAAAPASVAAPPSAAVRIAWVASVAAVLLGFVALHAFRVEIAAAWPPMLRLYGALGLL